MSRPRCAACGSVSLAGVFFHPLKYVEMDGLFPVESHPYGGMNKCIIQPRVSRLGRSFQDLGGQVALPDTRKGFLNGVFARKAN